MDSVSTSFQVKKEKILHDLAVPDEEYSDLSPKGSVDLNIRPLIRDINGLPGLVTTSSCAGRISVFLEGEGRPKREANQTGVNSQQKWSQQCQERDVTEEIDHEHQANPEQERFVSTGGKGGGKWLFVSHDPIVIKDEGNEGGRSGKRAHEILGLIPGDGNIDLANTEQLRLIRFHFEPMVW